MDKKGKLRKKKHAKGTLKSYQIFLIIWAAILLSILSLRHTERRPAEEQIQTVQKVQKQKVVQVPETEKAHKILKAQQDIYQNGHKFCYTSQDKQVKSSDSCYCEAGYEGPDCTIPVCLPSCNHGKCISPNKCKCKKKWSGRSCDEPICEESCMHGFCVQPDKCSCDSGWFGAKCNFECVHGKSDPDYEESCLCHEGWKGDSCNVAICESKEFHDCQNGFCSKPNTCSCDPGWSGDHCNFDVIDEYGDKLLSKGLIPEIDLMNLNLNRNSPEQSWTAFQKIQRFLSPMLRTNKQNLFKLLPSNDSITGHEKYIMHLQKGERYDRCAVVSDASGLLDMKFGEIIDKHQAVLRFNGAPTEGYEEYVGRKTTFRIHNRRSSFALARASSSMRSPKSKPISILWKPESWHLLPHLKKHNKDIKIEILDPQFIKLALQTYKLVLDNSKLLGIPDIPKSRSSDVDDPTIALGSYRTPTSFIGITMMTQICKKVNLFGFDPPSIHALLKQKGISSKVYYESNDERMYDSHAHSIFMYTAREDDDQLMIHSPLNLKSHHGGGVNPASAAELLQRRTHISGEQYAGYGVEALKGFDLAVLRLYSILGKIQICNVKNARICVRN